MLKDEKYINSAKELLSILQEKKCYIPSHQNYFIKEKTEDLLKKLPRKLLVPS